MAQQFRKGQRVNWSAGQGETTGKVEDYLTNPKTVRLYRIDYAADVGKCQLIKQRNRNRSKFLNP
jgi:hypothetical protein